eukprot:3865930-Rhodomonas_salina.2
MKVPNHSWKKQQVDDTTAGREAELGRLAKEALSVQATSLNQFTAGGGFRPGEAVSCMVQGIDLVELRRRTKEPEEMEAIIRSDMETAGLVFTEEEYNNQNMMVAWTRNGTATETVMLTAHLQYNNALCDLLAVRKVLAIAGTGVW